MEVVKGQSWHTRRCTGKRKSKYGGLTFCDSACGTFKMDKNLEQTIKYMVQEAYNIKDNHFFVMVYSNGVFIRFYNFTHQANAQWEKVFLYPNGMLKEVKALLDEFENKYKTSKDVEIDINYYDILSAFQQLLCL